MAHEKFDAQVNLGSKDTAPYTTPSSEEEDVEVGQPKPLMRALESRHMQMIAIVSPSLSPTYLQGIHKKEQAP
jgi:amino acid permease